MAGKERRVYTCQSCGHQERKWLGRCPGCESWNSLQEEVVAHISKKVAAKKALRATAVQPISEIEISESPRTLTQIAELDRVLGGGLVPGALVLVGGDPGIGKSTLLLQAMGALAEQGERVLYVSAEESPQQVKLRAERLGIDSPNLYLLAETQFEGVLEAKREVKPTVVVLDSIQTIGLGSLDSAVGTVSQIRGVTAQLLELAKGEHIATFVVGHVTKDGAIAGPKLMEHMVDTVLYFEGERSGPYRLLRAHKNRFGSAQELGVFEMTGEGLRPVSNPSELFLSQRSEAPGACVVGAMEGSRTLLLEVQALVSPSPYGTPRRTVVGVEQHRAAMLAAVTAARGDVDLAGCDLFLNVAGGVRVHEPAVDLGLCLAMASAHREKLIDPKTVVIGEVGLSGEVRAVTQLDTRLAEAATLGFTKAIVPKVSLGGPYGSIDVAGVKNLEEAIDAASLGYGG